MPAALLACVIGAEAWAGEDAVRHGEYLLHAGGCISCHASEDAQNAPLAGGRALQTAFGTFYPPNITPDRETGIGAWSDEDFIRAFHEGTSPWGEPYYPAFPYIAYAGLSRDDLLAVKASLFALAPVHRANRPHELRWYASYRPVLWLWKWLYFEPGVFRPEPDRSAQWNRGAYLVRHLGHCGECHTSRDWLGGLQRQDSLAGNPDGPQGDAVPNITPDRATGIGRWSASDLVYFLQTGMLPDGDFAGGSMSDVIDDNTSHLSQDDLEAIAGYLLSLPAVTR